MLRKLLISGFIAMTLLLPRAALALTVDEVVALAKAGVTDTVILALIDRDRTVFAIEPQQIVALQRDGLSQTVILALLKSGRAEGDQAARADSAYNAAWMAAGLTTEPASITVGHGPDRPNASPDVFSSGPAAGGFYAPFSWVARSSRGHADRRRTQQPAAGQQPATVPPPPGQPLIGAPPVDTLSSPLCLAQVRGAHSSAALSFVTECPAAMQTRRR